MEYCKRCGDIDEQIKELQDIANNMICKIEELKAMKNGEIDD